MADITQMAARSGKLIRSDNTIVNEADGINDDGSRRVQLTGSIVRNNVVTIANSVAITTTGYKTFSLIDAGLTQDEIRRYKNFKISVFDTHNQPATLEIYTTNLSLAPNGSPATGALIYKSDQDITNGNNYLAYCSGQGGTGASIKVIPSLRDIHSNISVRLNFSVAPTSGSITIKVEMQE